MWGYSFGKLQRGNACFPGVCLVMKLGVKESIELFIYC
jgi:hypothetical protein